MYYLYDDTCISKKDFTCKFYMDYQSKIHDGYLRTIRNCWGYLCNTAIWSDLNICSFIQTYKKIQKVFFSLYLNFHKNIHVTSIQLLLNWRTTMFEPSALKRNHGCKTWLKVMQDFPLCVLLLLLFFYMHIIIISNVDILYIKLIINYIKLSNIIFPFCTYTDTSNYTVKRIR